ncbi:MAG: substrate-binding domain-containing protein [Eubacteriales bacterium]
MKMKKIAALALGMVMTTALLTGCASTEETTTTTQEVTTAETSNGSSSDDSTEAETQTASGLITVLTREDGSGTRGAFTEITGVHDGENDHTTVEASVQDSTGKVMTAVASDPQAIGYISLGSFNDTVKAIAVEGVYPTVESILDGTYAVARPFYIATVKDTTLDPVTEEFLTYLFTQEAQDVVAEEGCVPVEVTTTEFVSEQPIGTITIGGSTSVYPVMEVLVEHYRVLNPNATINIEGVGSSAGMNGAMEGTFHIGMASRDMKDSELETLTGYVLAKDGIAMIVNTQNPTDNLTVEQIKSIYTGEVTDYSELN